MLSVPRHRRALVVAVTLAVAGFGPVTVMAQSERAEAIRTSSELPRPQARERAPERSLSDAVRRVQRETGGRILGAERVPYDGRDINRVKFMDDRGRVRYMDDPAPSRSTPRTPRPADVPPRGANP